MREVDLEGHFTQGEADPKAPTDEVTDAADEAEGEESEASDDEEATDHQLDRAIEVLKSWTYFENLRENRPTPSLQAKAPETTSETTPETTP
jgi:hypothetical protein